MSLPVYRVATVFEDGGCQTSSASDRLYAENLFHDLVLEARSLYIAVIARDGARTWLVREYHREPEFA